jgi:hypothetical protein
MSGVTQDRTENRIEHERRAVMTADENLAAFAIVNKNLWTQPHKIRLAGSRAPVARCLTQREIDARELGWEHGSNSTNAMMARVLASGG